MRRQIFSFAFSLFFVMSAYAGQMGEAHEVLDSFNACVDYHKDFEGLSDEAAEKKCEHLLDEPLPVSVQSRKTETGINKSLVDHAGKIITSPQTTLIVVSGLASAVLLSQLMKATSLKALRSMNPALALLPPQVIDEYIGLIQGKSEEPQNYTIPDHAWLDAEDIKAYYSLSESEQKRLIDNHPEFARYLNEVAQSISQQELGRCYRSQLCA